MHLLIKCIETKYAKKMVEYGELKFSSPITWINNSKTGRRDKFEGAYAVESIFEINNRCNNRRKNDEFIL